MVYIERDANKDIIGIYSLPQYKGQKKLKKHNKEVVAFFKKTNVIYESRKIDGKKMSGKTLTALNDAVSVEELKAVLKTILFGNSE